MDLHVAQNKLHQVVMLIFLQHAKFNAFIIE